MSISCVLATMSEALARAVITTPGFSFCGMALLGLRVVQQQPWAALVILRVNVLQHRADAYRH